MDERRAAASAQTPAHARRRVLTLLSTAACGVLALAVTGCGQERTESRDRPDWMRSKRGSNGNGRGRQ